MHEPTTIAPTADSKATVDPDDTPEPAESSNATPNASGESERPTPPPGPDVPQDLVGRWVSTGSGNAEIIYEFGADGSYKYAGVLLQQRDTGTFSFTRSAVGTFRVEGNALILQPDHGTEKVEDPDVPSASDEHPIDTTQETLEWGLDAAGQLSLTDSSGTTIVYALQ